MGKTMRVSLAGYNALTETDITKYSIYADSDNILIKEQSRGSGTIAYNNDATINHALGYIPFFLVYCQVNTGRYRIANAFDPIGSGWQVYTTSSDLVIGNRYSSTYTGYKYYIFHDEMGS